MTISFQIIGFHNCDGCLRKVKHVVRKIGVRLVELNRETGVVMIQTVEAVEVIRHALERQLKKPVVTLSRDLVPENQNPNLVVPHQVPANRGLDLQELGQVVLRLAEVLDGVEITNSNTMTIRFNHRENPTVVRSEPRGNIRVQIKDADVEDAHVEYAPPRPPPRSPPWVATEPSAPVTPMAEQAVYGYPSDIYGLYASHSHDHPNCRCTII